MKTTRLWKLTMRRGKRAVFIGYMASQYRAAIVADNLDWTGGWKPVIELT